MADKKKAVKGITLAQGLIAAMKAIDNQIARKMQRSPAEREEAGVQKWSPYAEKVEQTTALVLDAFGSQDIELDSVLVTSQAMVKALYLIIEEVEDLGKLRTEYCQDALEKIDRDVRQALSNYSQEKLN